MMLVDGLWPAWIGLASGLVGAAFVVQLVRRMLYGVQPLDWTVFAGVALVLSLVCSFFVRCTGLAGVAARTHPGAAGGIAGLTGYRRL